LEEMNGDRGICISRFEIIGSPIEQNESAVEF
jgi:hypothetical protein